MSTDTSTESPSNRIPFSFRNAVSAVRKQQGGAANVGSAANSANANGISSTTNVATQNNTSSSPSSRLSRFHSFGGSTGSAEVAPGALSRSETDKRLAEAVSELTAKYSSLLETHNNTLDENSRLQREVVRLQTENRRLMETAAQQQAAFENEANSADAVTATNIRLMDELASERRYVQRMARDRDELEADFKKREADFVAVVEEDSRRMTKALEVLQSKLESKNKTLESKLDEISRLKAHIFSLETAINRVEAAFPGDIALAAALKDVPDRIHSLEKPMTPPSRSDQSIAPALNSESVQESEKVENKVSQEEKNKLLDEIQALREIISHHSLEDKGSIEFVMSSSSDKLYLKCIEAILSRSERGSDPKNRYRAAQLDLLDLVALLDESLISLQSSIMVENIENSALTGLLSHLSGSQKHSLMNLLIAMPSQEFTRGPKNPFIDMSPPASQSRPLTPQLSTSSSWRRPSKARVEAGDAAPPSVSSSSSSLSMAPSSSYQARRPPPPSPRNKSSTPDVAFERGASDGYYGYVANVTPFDASPSESHQNYYAEADKFNGTQPTTGGKIDIREQRTLAELESLAYNVEASEVYNSRSNRLSHSDTSSRGSDYFSPGNQTSDPTAAQPKRRVSMNPFSNLLYELNPELYEQQKRQEAEATSKMGHTSDANAGSAGLQASASPGQSRGTAADEWTPVLDASSGNIYYFNRATMETSWNRPL